MGVLDVGSLLEPWRGGAAERMTALDASFLDAESERTPLHIGALCILEGGPLLDEDGELRLDEVRARVAERLHLFPRFRQRVRQVPLGAGLPVWVDDEGFDIARHVRTARLEQPGDREVLLEACEELQATPLPRDRPLWELWFLTGLDDGRVAMVEKVHHAMVDGVSGVEVAAALLDLTPDAPRPVAPAWTARPAPGWARLMADGAAGALGLPLALARDAASLALRPADLVGRVAALADTAVIGLTAGGPRNRTSLHRQVGDRRLLRPVRAPLEDLRTAAHALGVTVNDMVLAAVAEGIRALLLSRGEDVDDLHLHVLVPVSVRTDDQHLDLGNRVAALVVPLPIGAGSALARVCEISNATRDRKRHHQAEHTELLLDAADRLPAGLVSLIARSIHHQPLVDTVVTNIPGPPVPLWFAGARMVESVPIVPLGGNLTVSIAVLSYDGTVTIGVHADAETCPDVEILADGMAGALDELVTAPWSETSTEEPAPVHRHRARRARSTLRLRGAVRLGGGR